MSINLSLYYSMIYTIYMFLKENLVYLRKKELLSQNELSLKLHVKRYNVADWEQGRSEPSIKMLCVICDFFRVRIDIMLNYNISIMSAEDLKFCQDISR